MSQQEIESVNPSQLLFQKAYKSVQHIRSRKPNRYYPINNTDYDLTATTGGGLITINVTHDQLDDTQSSCLSFELDMDSDVNIANVGDLFQEVAVYLNDEKLESYQDAAIWQNNFIKLTANDSWASAEGSALMGYNIDASGGSGSRSYIVPLAMFYGICRIPNFLPLLGAKLRFEFRLQNNALACLKTINADAAKNAITVKDVSLLSDMIEVSDSYRSALLTALQGDIGVKLPYTTYDTRREQVVNTTKQILIQDFHYSNALSLYVLKKQPNVTTTGTRFNQSANAKFDTFERLEVTCGAQLFHEPGGIRGLAELYRSTELSTTSLADLSGTGLLGFTQFKDENTVLGVNLEKLVMPDDESPMDSGLSSSAHGASTQLRIQIEANTAMGTSDQWFSCLVHRNVLVMKQSGIRTVQ